MSQPLMHKLSLVLPILFYLLALVSLRLHLKVPAGDTPLLVVAMLSGVAALGTGALLVYQQRAMVERVSSRG